MAAINSHRKRQNYVDPRNPNHITRNGGAPYHNGAVMIGPKVTRGDEYWSATRWFGNLERFTLGGYLNVNEYYAYSVPRGAPKMYAFNPAGLMDPYQGRGRVIAIDAMNYNSKVAGFFNYQRKYTGLMGNNNSSTYKKVGTVHKHVYDLGGAIGGNIKSRQAAAKWTIGMWRAK